jgi:hypothetical protein
MLCYVYAECRCAECRYAECRGAITLFRNVKMFSIMKRASLQKIIQIFVY